MNKPTDQKPAWTQPEIIKLSIKTGTEQIKILNTKNMAPIS